MRKTLIRLVCILSLALPSGAAAQMQPLSEDEPAAAVMAGLIAAVVDVDRGAAREYLRTHSEPTVEYDALEMTLLEILDLVNAEESAVVAGTFSHPDVGAVTMLASASGLRLFIAVQISAENRIIGLQLPAGGWQSPPPPPVVEAAIPGLLDYPQRHEVIAFANVAVLPLDDERVLANHTVIVRDGIISEMGPAETVTVPEAALIIDGSGRYLMPGLSEMHAHIPIPEEGEGALQRTLFLFIANGVTTLRGMLGHAQHLSLRDEEASSEMLLPRVYTSSPSINGASAPTPEAGVSLVEAYHAAGYDFLKIHPGLTRATYDAVVEAAMRLGLKWAGHVPGQVGLTRALDAGQITIDHLDAYVEALAGRGDGFSSQESGFFGLGLVDQVNADRVDELARQTRAARVWNVPTQSLFEHLLSPYDAQEILAWPEMRYMPEQTLQQWAEAKSMVMEQAGTAERAQRYLDIRRRLIAALYRAGAGLLLGADAPQWFNVPGFSAHRELQFLVEAGLTPYEALVAGTRNPATYLNAADWGTIQVGKAADMILLDANPLEDMSHVAMQAGVMVRGYWLSEDEIATRLQQIARALETN